VAPPSTPPTDRATRPPTPPAERATVSSRRQLAPAAAARSEPRANGSARKSGSVATGIFSPEDGSLLLRVTPIYGFQALIRVQDTLMRLNAVREASVEAFFQGEARLRIHLSAPIEPSSLAASLSEGLEQEWRVATVSLPERSLKIALGG